jgi:hypothetical protein
VRGVNPSLAALAPNSQSTESYAVAAEGTTANGAR